MKENLKVLMINGSPKSNGNTSIALREMEKVFKENGVDVETVTVGNKAIRGCVACNSCYEKGKCVFDDIVNELAPKFEEADGLVVASPVYYASANATLVACLDRLFYSSHFDKTMKVGASIAVPDEADVRRHLTNSINILPYPECRLHPASTGTVFTEELRVKPKRTKKASRPCAPLLPI